MAETVSSGVALELPQFDKLWNYAKPAETEARFREVLAQAAGIAPLNYRLELLTQIARCQGLQGSFDLANATLDEVERDLLHDRSTDVARSRYLLERGRLHNSSGDPAAAMRFFDQACEV